MSVMLFAEPASKLRPWSWPIRLQTITRRMDLQRIMTSEGNLVRAIHLSGRKNERIRSVAASPSGDFYVVGSLSAPNVTVTIGNYTSPPTTHKFTMFLAKFGATSTARKPQGRHSQAIGTGCQLPQPFPKHDDHHVHHTGTGQGKADRVRRIWAGTGRARGRKAKCRIVFRTAGCVSVAKRHIPLSPGGRE